ncbi:hypothetical protein niasHS_007540 [Heterodera schachtii]|uniref:Transmembrane protein n=1 Tax=Heterodera schachtii TaxID=97005 RepID=A0ABD2JXU8_HETSC
MARKGPFDRLPPLFLLLGFSVFAASFCFSSPLPKHKRTFDVVHLAKRFYAWDEMSAKRSLIPPEPKSATTKLEQIETEQSAAEERGEMPKFYGWKRSLQQRPLPLARLFFRAVVKPIERINSQIE